MSTTTVPVPTEATPKNLVSRLNQFLGRFFTRHVLHMALLVMIISMLAQPLHSPKELIRDPDIWWHLANARQFLATGQFVHTEPYSFSVAGLKWINPEWASELPFWFGYQWFHLCGLYLVTLSVLAANLLLVYWRCYRKSLHISAAFWSSALAYMLMTINSGPRTILFAYLAMSVELFLIDEAEQGRGWLLWLLPPLFAIWINLHGSWLIGMALFGLYVLSGTFSISMGAIDQMKRSPALLKRQFFVLVCSMLALLANPYSWRLIWNPLDMMFNQSLNVRTVLEWQPLNLGWLVGKCAFLCILLFIASNLIRGRCWKLYELGFVLFAWYAAFSHARFTFLAAIVMTPFLADEMARSLLAPADKKTIPLMNALLTAVALASVLHWFPTEAYMQNARREVFPLNSIAQIQPGWRTYNTYEIGGAMDMEGKSPYVDSRVDIFEHQGVFKNYMDINSMKQPLELLDKERIDHALINSHNAVAYLLERTPGWLVVTREGTGDDCYELFQRQSPAPKSNNQGGM
jgi:hypothetical protein